MRLSHKNHPLFSILQLIAVFRASRREKCHAFLLVTLLDSSLLSEEIHPEKESS